MNEPIDITGLLKVTSRLIGVLEREIEMLRAMKPSELQSLQQDKIVLTAAYEAQVRVLKDRPELLEDMAPALRAELRNAIGKFQDSLAENERALRAAKDTTERVLHAIAEEVGRKRRENAGYSALSAADAPTRSSSHEPISFAFDQTF